MDTSIIERIWNCTASQGWQCATTPSQLRQGLQPVLRGGSVPDSVSSTFFVKSASIDTFQQVQPRRGFPKRGNRVSVSCMSVSDTEIEELYEQLMSIIMRT